MLGTALRLPAGLDDLVDPPSTYFLTSLTHLLNYFLQVSTIWSILLRDFEMEMTSPLPKPAYNDMVVGPDGKIMVNYKRKVPKA